MDMSTLTEFTAQSYEARPAGTLSSDVVTVCSVLTATHLRTLRPVETCRTAWRGIKNCMSLQQSMGYFSV